MGPEPAHTAGITTALMLAHVESCGGRGAVEAVLERIGKPGREAALRDERSWWSWDTKIALFEAAAAVLGDPDVTYTAGRTALDRGVAAPLKTALRALGSPALVYSNIVRANHKFSTNARMVLEQISGHHALLRYEHVGAESTPHRLDCLYNQGLLSCVPVLFGLPPARIEHPACALRGATDCVYDVHWQPQLRPSWRLMAGWGAGAAALVAAATAVAPVLAAPAVAAAAAGLGWRTSRRRAELVATLTELQREREEVVDRSERVRASLHAMSAALMHDEVVSRITDHTSRALGGNPCVLLVNHDGALRPLPGPWLTDALAHDLGRWAGRAGARETVTVDDVALVAELAALPGHAPPVGSLCAAPLRAHGELLGLLVALAPRSFSFLPEDVVILELFAEQAAVALSNARLYAAQQELATRDPLTGLGNHRDFHDALERELARCRRTGARFALAMLDLDGFKAVNDTGGHAAGDRLLREVGAALDAAARGADVAFRVGGDEFAVLLPESGYEAGCRAAERIAAAAASADGRVGVSWGVAAWPEDGAGKDELLARADERLYAMKRAHGRSAPARIDELVAALEAGTLDAAMRESLERLARRVTREA